MDKFEQVEQQLAEVGPVVEGLQGVTRTDEGRWNLIFEDHDVIFVVCDKATSMLTFVDHVGEIPEENRATVHQVLLHYNALWEQTAGLVTALDDDEGLMQILHVFADLDSMTLIKIIEDLRAKAKAWRTVLPDLSEESPCDEAPDSPTTPLGTLRV